MPMPWSCRHASKDFRAFLANAQERLGTPTDNMTYTAVDAVLTVFRKRLTVEQGLMFCDVLPAVLRAVFVDRWHKNLAPVAFFSRDLLIKEVKAVRQDHNLTPDHAIQAVAAALRSNVNQCDLGNVLNQLPVGAVDYWQVDTDPRELEREIM